MDKLPDLWSRPVEDYEKPLAETPAQHPPEVRAIIAGAAAIVVATILGGGTVLFLIAVIGLLAR